MRPTSCPSFQRSALLAIQLVTLVACQSPTRVKMVEIEKSLPANSENRSSSRISKDHLAGPAQKVDVIEKSDNLWDRLQTQFQLENHYDNTEVDDELAAYIYNQPYFDRITERAEPFLFWIVSEIERRHLPMELALIPIVESTFNPNAYSPKHAVGLWQFIGPTAKSLVYNKTGGMTAGETPELQLSLLWIFWSSYTKNLMKIGC